MSAVTPEKVKNLLSSFILATESQAPSQVSLISLECPEEKTGSKDVKRSNKDEAVSKEKSNSGNNNRSALRGYDSFMLRFRTFSSLTWFGKPACVSPLVCARWGWEVAEPDTLQCVACGAFLHGPLPLKAQSSIYDDCVERLKNNLKAAHSKFCVFAVNPCSESFCEIPLAVPKKLISRFQERLTALTKIKDKLPAIDYSKLSAQGYDEGQGSAYARKHLTPLTSGGQLATSDPPPASVTALAFMGWTVSQRSVCVLFLVLLFGTF